MTRGWHRWISVLLVCMLVLMPGISCAQEESAWDVLYAEGEAMYARMSALTAEEATFEFQGETYALREGVDYANKNLFGTADYDLYCTALMEAMIARSNRIGEAFLEEIRKLNETAVSLGYEHYLDYQWQSYGLDGDPGDVLRMFMTQYPKTFGFILENNWLSEEDLESALDDQTLLEIAAQAYGQIDPGYETAIRDLIGSDAFLCREQREGASDGYTTNYNASCDPPVTVMVSGSGTCRFLITSAHEFGHYLHEIATQGRDEGIFFEVLETHSIAGTILCEAAIEEALARELGEAYGAYCTLQYMDALLGSLVDMTVVYLTVEDMYLHPEAHQGEDFAKSYLDLYLAAGVDGGYSEAYQMMLGSDWWYVSDGIFAYPGYLPTYAKATHNAIWLWYQQAQGADAAQLYRELISTAVPDIGGEAFLREMGFPDPMDPQTYAELDDFVYDKLVSLYVEAFGEEPY